MFIKSWRKFEVVCKSRRQKTNKQTKSYKEIINNRPGKENSKALGSTRIEGINGKRKSWQSSLSGSTDGCQKKKLRTNLWSARVEKSCTASTYWIPSMFHIQILPRPLPHAHTISIIVTHLNILYCHVLTLSWQSFAHLKNLFKRELL